MMRLTIVSPAIWGGGTERMACLLASSWAQQGRAVTLLSFDKANAPAFPIDPSVKLRSLDLVKVSSNLSQGLRRNLWRIGVLRRAIRDSRPDIVVSFASQINIVTLLATRGLTRKVVITEVADPSSSDIAPIWSALRKLIYPWAEALVCPTATVLTWFRPKAQRRGRVIPCPVIAPSKSAMLAGRSKRSTSSHIMVAMGRLVHEKGFDLLLSAFAKVADRHPEWSLKIIGNGALRSVLETRTRVLKLAKRISFTGELIDPFSVLCAADLFVFPSRCEGFGLALCEAMACGLPVVSFDCPSGPRNIIRHGVDGILVPAQNTEALTRTLDRLMRDRKERQRLAERAPEVITRFGVGKILPLWQELFDQLVPERGNARLQSSPRWLGTSATS